MGILENEQFRGLGEVVTAELDRAVEAMGVVASPLAREVGSLFLASIALETGPREPFTGTRPFASFDTPEESQRLLAHVFERLPELVRSVADGIEQPETGAIVTALDVLRWLSLGAGQELASNFECPRWPNV